MKRFFVTGINGSGKSTLAEKIIEHGIPAIDLDSVKDLCIWINKRTGERKYWSERIGKEFYEENEYTCNEEMLVDLMNSSKNDYVVVLGLADNQSKLFHLFDKIFLLRCDEDVFIQRMIDRTSHNFGKEKLEQEMIRSYYKSFEQEMIDKGAVPINTNSSPEDTFKQFLEKIS